MRCLTHILEYFVDLTIAFTKNDNVLSHRRFEIKSTDIALDTLETGCERMLAEISKLLLHIHFVLDNVIITFSHIQLMLI